MNMNAQAYNEYKKSTVETVAPEKLIVMLFEGLLKNIRYGKKAIEDNNFNQAHNEIMNAEKIMIELMSSLNMDYEISTPLFNLYEYMHYQLVQANAKKDLAILSEVESFGTELRDTWQEALNKIKQSPVTQPGPQKATSAPTGASPYKPSSPGSISGLNVKG